MNTACGSHLGEKVVLITGASKGIGAATALAFAKRGYAIGLNYLHDDLQARQVLSEVTRWGVPAILLKADVSQAAEVDNLFARLDAELGRLDVLVNNVGIVGRQSRVVDMDADRILHILQTNVLSAFLCSKYAIQRMSTRYQGRGGVIINLSSAAARLGSPHEYVDYAASKRRNRYHDHRSVTRTGSRRHQSEWCSTRLYTYIDPCGRR